MAEMQVVASALAAHLGNLARLDIDLTEIAEEFDATEPYLEGEGDWMRDIRGAIRLAMRDLAEKTNEYRAMAEARSYTKPSDVLGTPDTIDHTRGG